jgi:hypothetical protein
MRDDQQSQTGPANGGAGPGPFPPGLDRDVAGRDASPVQRSRSDSGRDGHVARGDFRLDGWAGHATHARYGRLP